MSRFCIALAAILLVFVASSTLAADKLALVDAHPLPALTRQFEQTSGWTGGDVAYSIPLGEDKLLWTFGDTFIGQIAGGRRTEGAMINNTFAWQPLSTGDQASSSQPFAPLKFFWKQSTGKPQAVIVPKEQGTYFWPADGVLHDGRLYLFCKRVRPQAAGTPGLQFEWFANALLEISNPQSDPTEWKYVEATLPGGPDAPRLGTACLIDGDYLYAYAMFPDKLCKGLDQPATVARIKLADLAKVFDKAADIADVRDGADNKDGSWQYWSLSGKGTGDEAS